MASKLAPQSLNNQQNDEVKTLIDRQTELQKEINQARIILREYRDANLKQKKSCRQKNPQIAQLEQKLSKLKADLKEVEHAISERGSTTNSVEVEQKPPQDSINDIGTLQEVSSSASEETHQSESGKFVPKDENNVIRPACRKCERFIEKLLEATASKDNCYKVINEKQETMIQEKEQQIEDLQKSLNPLPHGHISSSRSVK